MTGRQTANDEQSDQLDAEWWTDFFDEDFGRIGFDTIEAQRTDKEAAFLIEQLNLKSGDRVFDQCCGVGRMSVRLASQGIHVIGVDLIDSYIDRAKRAARDSGIEPQCSFHCADALDFISPEPCDGAINWWTSFGYSESDEINVRMIQRAYDSLKPGGRFLLEYTSIPHVMRMFRPREFRTVETPDGPITMLMEHTPNFLLGMLDVTWTFIRSDGTRHERRSSTRMYMPHELVALFRRCGFFDIQLLGSMEAEEMTLNMPRQVTPRCIVIGRRPE